MALTLLSSCGVRIRHEDDVATTTEPSVITTSEVTTSETTLAEENSGGASTAPTTEPTTEPTTVSTDDTTEVTTSETTVASEDTVGASSSPISDTTTATDPEPIAYPVFDDSFYTRLRELFDRFEINMVESIDPEREKKDASGKVVEPRDKCVSVYYYDIETGYELYINDGVHYPVASVVKIPFCTMIYEKITAGEIDPEMVMTYEKRHYFHGTGIVNKGKYGDQYTVRRLLQLSVTESDNTAYEMLKDLVSWDDFEAYMQERGASHETDTRPKYQKVCLESAGSWGRILADYLRSDSLLIDEYKYDLTHTKNKMINSEYTVYRKYGWTNFAFHDIAYIEAPKPYVLAVLTNLEGEERADYTFYYNLTRLVEEYALKDRT